MYTAEPTDSTDVTALPELPAEGEQPESQAEKLLNNISRYIRSHTAGDFAGLSPRTEKTQYTHNSRALKPKGGNPPKDYSLAEDFVDLQKAALTADLEQALPLYFKLRQYA